MKNMISTENFKFNNQTTTMSTLVKIIKTKA
jgi:hypothetical protein